MLPASRGHQMDDIWFRHLAATKALQAHAYLTYPCESSVFIWDSADRVRSGSFSMEQVVVDVNQLVFS